MLNGASAPQSVVGSEGDFYINTATNQIYGPKTASGWGIGTSLVGPQGAQGIQGPQGPAGATGPQGLQGPAGPVGATGAQGSSMLSGTGTPASSLGVNGDSYVDAATGTVYKKTSGTWTSTGQTLKGPQGVAGPAGATGPQGLQGPTGPSGVITATNGLIYTANTQTVSLPTATNGQVLKWNGTAWAPGTDNNTNTTYTAGTGLSLSGTTFSHAAHTGDVTGTTSLTIANNAVNSAKIADGSVSTVDLAAGAVTADKLNQMNATNGQVLKWNGTAWAPAADNNTNTTYSGSTSITLSGTSFQRAALTGDVTAAANNNITTVARIQGRNVANTAPASGQVLKWNGTAWAPAADDNTNTTYTAGTGLSLSGTTFSHAAHTGDVTGTTSLTIANNAVNSAKIADGSVSTVDLAAGAVTADKLNQMNATNGQVLKWNGTAWAPAADNNTNTTYSGSTSITLSGTSFQRAALAGDVTAAANNNTTTVARIQGRNVANTTPASGQVLKWNGTAWAPAADDNTNTTYSGSTSITLSGTSFQRAALTGDVTAAVNNNTTTVARIQGRNVANTTPASGQVLKWNGTAWAPAADDNTNTNIYNTNGTLTGARTVNMGTNNLMFTGTGNIGIGTQSPSQKLEVSGNAKISQMTDATSLESEYTKAVVAKPDGTLGVVSRTNPTIPSGVDIIYANPFEYTDIMEGKNLYYIEQNPAVGQYYFRYTGYSITLPPGQWMIYCGYLLGMKNAVFTNQTVWVKARISETKTNQRTDFQGAAMSGGPKSISTNILPNTNYSMANGIWIVNNTSTTAKTYYVQISFEKINGTFADIPTVSASLSDQNNIPHNENYLFALKRN